MRHKPLAIYLLVCMICTRGHRAKADQSARAKECQKCNVLPSASNKADTRRTHLRGDSDTLYGSKVSAELDWSGIRAAAIAMGSVNAAAIQAGANLPPDEAERLRERINKKALRHGWMAHAKQLMANKPQQAKPLSNSVQSGADSLANSLADDSQATRIHISQAARRGAKHIAESDPAHIAKGAQNLRHLAATASQVHGWEEKRDTSVTVNLLNVSGATAL